MFVALVVAQSASALTLTNPLETTTPLLLDSSRVFDLDEITVIAQPKESQRLRMQPLSSTVFGAKELSTFKIQDLSQLSAYVPSFVVPAYGSRLTSSFYVRGIGSRTGSPVVGAYYDNIPLIGKTALNNHYYMLDRVDVLRGPQGTLYGVNTEGGLLRVYSKNPMQYQGTDVMLGVGTGTFRNVELAHFHRPSDKLAFSIAGFYRGQNGFFTNTHLGERNDQTNEAGGKLRLIWKPVQRLTVDVTSDYQYVNQTAFPYGYYDLETEETSDPSTTFTNSYRRQMVNSGVNVSYDFGRLLFTSTTSHQYLWDRMHMDQDYLPEDYMRLKQLQRQNAITQEFALKSQTTSIWQHTTGLFGSYQWLSTDAPIGMGPDMNSYIKSMWGMPATVANMLTLQDNEVTGNFHTPTLNLGAFHESRLSLSNRLVATLGIRYDFSQVKINYNTASQFSLGMRGAFHQYLSVLEGSDKQTYQQLLPKIGLTYKIDDSGSNVYATVSKGFRAGGYNIQMFSDIFSTEERSLSKSLMGLMAADMTVSHTAQDIDNINNTISYKPETTWNYEVGTHLNLFGGRLQADLAAFYMQVRNQQLSVMASEYGYGRMMVNAGKTNTWGAEATLRGSAFDNHLSWTATYSFTMAKFDEYTDSVYAADGSKVLADYKDKYVPFVPKHTFCVSADYRIDCNHDIFHDVVFGANLAGNGRTYWNNANTASQKVYTQLGAHFTINFGKADLNFWGKNLMNTKYNTFYVSESFGGKVNQFAQQGNPVQVGVDLRLHI